MLAVEALDAGYGEAQILFGVDLDDRRRRGRDAARPQRHGQDHDDRAIMGLIAGRRPGASRRRPRPDRRPPFRIAQAGIGLVPEGRQIFPTLSVEENLIATAASRRQVNAGRRRPNYLGPGRIYAFFPRLKERRANRGNQLSGGEQQMLAIGRALMTNPRLIILDEATEGLAPIIRQEIWACLAALKAEGESHPRHRQECRRAGEDRRPSCRAGEGPRRLARHQRRSAQRPRGQGPLPASSNTQVTSGLL